MRAVRAIIFAVLITIVIAWTCAICTRNIKRPMETVVDSEGGWSVARQRIFGRCQIMAFSPIDYGEALEVNALPYWSQLRSSPAHDYGDPILIAGEAAYGWPM